MFKLIQVEDIKKTSKGEFGTEFDFLLGSIIIPSVTRLFARYCHRPDFDKTARTEYLSPRPGQSKLYLASPPVALAQVGPPAIEALRLYEDTAVPRVYGADTELVSGEDFFLFEEQGMIEADHRWFACGPKVIKVTYTGGYLTDDAADCPEDLRLAAIVQSKILFDHREQFGLTSQSLEGGSIGLTPDALPTKVRIMLDSFVVPCG